MIAKNTKVLIDTNVLIYATLRQDSRHTQAKAIFDAAASGNLKACISVQNLSEMYPNLTGPKMHPTDSPSVARKKIESISRLRYLEVLPVTQSVVAKALELCEQYDIRKQNYFDMQLVAVMLLNGVSTLMTENVKDFAQVKDVQVLSPFE